MAQLTGTGAYMLGNIVEVGINPNGHEGTYDIAGSNSRSDQWDPAVYFCFVANPQNDGWGNYDGDFFTPGSPENGFGIEVNGINYSNNSAYYYEIPNAPGLSNFTVDGNCLSVQWDGEVAGVHVTQIFKLNTTELYYTTEVTLTNNTGAALTDLYYYRNFDPDNNVSISFDYTTTNTIVAQPTIACPKALVSATSNVPWLSYVGIAAIGENFRVTHGGFTNRDASDIWNGVWPFGAAVGSSAFMDEAISMAYKVANLPAGDSETFEFVIILDDTQVDEAFAQLYEFNFAGYTGAGSVCNPIMDTAYVPCPGSVVTLSMAGPSVNDYTWTWSPATGLSSTTGAVVDASPAVTTLYTVTGTPVNPCLSLTIEKEIVVNVGVGPLVQITDPGPVCGTFDLTTLVVTDVNNIPGTTTTFHSAPPTGPTDMTNQWPTSTMVNGDIVYVMIADAVGGCFDYEQVIIDFSGGSTAGPDSTANLCNTIGTTLDLNTLLSGSTAGGTWAETTAPASGQFNTATGVFDASGLSAGDYTFTYTTNVVAPCTPDVALMTVTVTEVANAGADNATSACNNAGSTVDLNTLLAGTSGPGTWTETSFSGQFDAVTGTLTATGLTAGNYTFTYTVAGCAPDVADFTVTVEQEALAGNDNAATLCNTAGSTLDLNTLLAGNNNIGTWLETTGSGQFTAATGIFDASGLAVGVYNFTYTVSANLPCVDDVADFAITVTNLPNAGADNATSLCNAVGVTLDMNTLLIGADPGGTWTETSAAPSGQFTPATGVLDATDVPAGTYTFTYSIAAAGPCPGDQALMTITIEQYAFAGADNSSSVCNAPGSTLDLNTLLAGNNGGGTWSETTATPSGQFNAGSGVFTSAGLNAGTYTFSFTVPAVAPCVADVADFTVTVIDMPTAGADNNTTVCNTGGGTVDLNTLLLGNNVGGVWSETTVPSSGELDVPSGIFTAAGLPMGAYTFNYTVPAIGACPADVATFTVNVNAEPIVNDLLDQAHCDTYTLPAITGTNLTGNQAYYTGPNGTGTQYNAGDVITTTTTLYIYDETGSVPNCFDEQQVTITINITPVPSFLADTLTGCAPLVVNFTNTTPTPTQNCVWNFGDGGFGQTCVGVQHTYLNPGTYTVTLNAQSPGACPAAVTYTNYITVYDQPQASFTFLPQFPDINDPEVTFTNASVFADSYIWDFGDNTGATDSDPVHVYPIDPNVDYAVTLYAYNNVGCVDSMTQIVTIVDVLTFYIPNGFTPDGDEFNQAFAPVFYSGVDPFNFHMTIFDRWGNVLFESYNKDFGWPGTYGDHGLVEDGVYIWQIEFKETMSDKKHTFNGHVTVLK